MAGEAAPNVKTIAASVPAAGAAVTQDQVIDTAPFAGTVTEVRLIPEAALTANATNFRTFRVLNKGQTGAGSTVVATFATDTVTTDDLAAFDEKIIPLSGTAANLVVAEGDTLAVDETVAASGVAHSGYRVEVDIARTAGS